MSIEEAVIMLFLWAGGTVLGLIITGLLADRLVVRKIMRNQEVQDLIKLFREGKTYLREILEHQKKKGSERMKACENCGSIDITETYGKTINPEKIVKCECNVCGKKWEEYG